MNLYLMNLYFMNTVGLTVGQRWEEILATGLIVGAGTKPLHDLVWILGIGSRHRRLYLLA